MAIKTAKGYRLTEEEGQYVRTYYPMMGTKKLAAKLGVGFHTIRNYVRKHDISAEQVPEGHISVTDATVELGLQSRASLHAKAVAHGVIKRRGKRADGKARLVSVPLSWVKEQKQQRPIEIAEELAEADWMTVKQAADYVGLNHTTLSNALRAFRGATDMTPLIMRYFEHARVLQAQSLEGRRPKYMLHPQDVEEARVMLERDARERESMYTIRQMADASGLRYETVWRRAQVREVPYTRYLDERNQVTAYFTAENTLRIIDKLPT